VRLSRFVLGFVIGATLGVLLLLIGGITGGDHSTDRPGACLTHSAQVEMHYPQPQCP
jgi:hypothetical protein